MKSNQMKWAIYARKSTESTERQVQSIDDQIKFAKEVASRESLNVVEIISEAKSAKEPHKREGFKKLIALIDDGEVDGLIVWKIDRLSRNPIESATIQYYLQKSKIKCIRTTEKSYFPEDNAIIFAVEQGMANQYVRDLSKNVKRGMLSKAEKGWFPNIPPIGYLNSKTHEKGSETILTDHARFPIIRKMWDLMLTGSYTPPKILDIATEEWKLTTPTRKRLGGKPLSLSYTYRLFTNPFFTGNFLYNGKLFKGNHEAMISMDEFEKVQIILGSRGKPQPISHEFPFTGFMNCGECGARITATIKKKFVKSKDKIETYVYYHCTKRKRGVKCASKRVNLGELEKDVLKLIETRTINPKFYDLGIETLKSMHGLETGQRQVIHESQQKAVLDIQSKIDRMLGFLLNGTIAEDIYSAEKKILEEELLKQKIKLTETEKRAQNWTVLIENTFHFTKAASLAFVEGDDQIRREILLNFGLNHSLNDKKLFIDLYSWFSVLKEGEKLLLPEIERLELDKTLDTKGRSEAFDSLRPRLCAGKDSNLRRHKSLDLQSSAIDHSATDAIGGHKVDYT